MIEFLKGKVHSIENENDFKRTTHFLQKWRSFY